MKYRRLGEDVEVSEIGFGCGDTAGLMIAGTPAERRNVVARALDVGINYFDTAPRYGNGLSETHLGEALKELGARPILGTKVALGTEELNDIPGAVARSMERSRSRLGVETIELIQLHNHVATLRTVSGTAPALSVEDVLGPRGVVEAFREQRQQGKVRLFGFTARGEILALYRLIDSGAFHALQVHYNILNPSAGMLMFPRFQPDFSQIIDRAAKRGMGVVAIRVLAAGALAGRDRLLPGAAGGPLGMSRVEYLENLERARALRFLEQERHRSLPQAAIRFVLMNPKVSTALLGISSLAHVETAASCSGAGGLSPAELSRLHELYRTDFGRSLLGGKQIVETEDQRQARS